MPSHKHTNRLIKESSPYLLQHAHNPVDWYPWSDEAFEKAKKEDKPVLVSIGYAACHWCHVMERESFEDEEVADLMNRNFINIKVDREERPDVDHIYMDAVQAMTGSGGWPLNVFLTPDRRPFYGGTYFPPRPVMNRASWPDVLAGISDTYRERKDQVEKQATTLTEHIRTSNSFGIKPADQNVFSIEKADEAYENVMKQSDREWGGFGRAPKFPQTFTISFLLQYAFIKNNQAAMDQALLSLDKMIMGGIYDQFGGGFARYSTDTEWLAPHFEKMLYDNALLIMTLSDAFLITGKIEYKRVIEQTLEFVERELMDGGGGFYSALDADSEDEEGKFYVWDYTEVNDILKDDAGIFCRYFDITPTGNWEGKNIPRRLIDQDSFAGNENLSKDELKEIIDRGIKTLMQVREKRVRPQLDDKVLLGWNALMNMAYCKAFAATARKEYKELAVRHMIFLLDAFSDQDGMFRHTWKNGRSSYPAFLDDLSYLVAALIELAQITSNLEYWEKAREITKLVLTHFSDSENLFFFFTHKDQNDIPVRKKEIYDGAIPSGNSVMAYNLYRLSIFFNLREWRERAEFMVSSMGEVACKYPTSFGVWLALLYEMIHGTKEIVVMGSQAKNYMEKILGMYISHKLAVAAETSLPGYPLLADKPETSEILIYLCENYACRKPSTSIQEFYACLGVNNFKNLYNK